MASRKGTMGSPDKTRMSFKVYALSADSGWLKKIAAVTDAPIKTHIVSSSQELPPPDVTALLLIDAADRPDVEADVRELRDRGWRYVIVVSDAFHWKDAYAVLRAGAYDYIYKPDVPSVLHTVIAELLPIPDIAQLEEVICEHVCPDTNSSTCSTG